MYTPRESPMPGDIRAEFGNLILRGGIYTSDVVPVPDDCIG